MTSGITPDRVIILRDSVSLSVGSLCLTGVVITLLGWPAQNWLFWLAIAVGLSGAGAIALTTILAGKAINASMDERDSALRTRSAALGYWVMVWGFAAAVLATTFGFISVERALVLVPLLAIAAECFSTFGLSQGWQMIGTTRGE